MIRVVIRFVRHIIQHICAKVKYYRKCEFDFSSIISKKSCFEGANKIYSNSSFSGSLGYGSYVGPFCSIDCHVGRFTSIAPFVKTNSGVHPITNPYATTCPMFFSTRKQCGYTFAKRAMFNEFKGNVVIGNDCWIGENVFIAGGVEIGDGAVVLAGATVVDDIPPYSVVGGVPAKIIRYRYDDETIKLLMDFKWWNRDLTWLRDNWELLCDINKLLLVIKGGSNL